MLIVVPFSDAILASKPDGFDYLGVRERWSELLDDTPGCCPEFEIKMSFKF